MKFKILFFACFFFIGHGFAQFPDDGEYQSTPNPDPIPAKPDYLGTLIDNSVPSDIQLKRISEYYAPTNWYPKIEYAKIQTWNSTGTKYKFYSLLLKDASTHEILKEMPAGDLYPSVWSNTEENLIYGFQIDGDIKTYDITMDDPPSVILSIPGYEYVKLGPGEGNIDANDKYAALVGKKNADLDVIIVDLDVKEIVTIMTFAGAWADGGENAPKYIDWVSVSQSGEYVGVMWSNNTTTEDNPFDGHFGVEIYNTIDMAYKYRIADFGNHGDFCYAQNGKEVFVEFWGPDQADFVNMYYLDGSGRVGIATHADFDAAGHISCRNLDRPGWLYLTISSSSQSGQIVALKLDDSGIVEHFGHHMSKLWSAMAVPSPDGTRVMFKSDFHEDLGEGEIYIYEATLAAPLAVDWVAPLVAFRQQDDVELTWTVAHQVDNDRFVAEHSRDGVHFEPIGRFDGDGSLAEQKTFRFLHKKAKSGDHYYRVKQVDYDGKYDFSNIVMVRVEAKPFVQLAPNPAAGEVTIYSNYSNRIEQVMVRTLAGKIVKTYDSGSNQLDVNDLQMGVYIVSIQMNGFVVEKMLVIGMPKK